MKFADRFVLSGFYLLLAVGNHPGTPVAYVSLGLATFVIAFSWEIMSWRHEEIYSKAFEPLKKRIRS